MKTVRDFVGITNADFLAKPELVTTFAHAVDLDLKSRKPFEVELCHLERGYSFQQPFTDESGRFIRSEINIDINETRSPLAFTIAHEMRHHFQCAMGWLTFHKKKSIYHTVWNDKRFSRSFADRMPHPERPWEIDADRFAFDIIRQLEIPYERRPSDRNKKHYWNKSGVW